MEKTNTINTVEINAVPSKTEKTLFRTVTNNIRPVSKYTGSIEVPLALCYVDQRYQKFRVHKNLKKLENNWDERKLSPIIIVSHPEEYRFAIVDGQGRFAVASKKGYETLPAIILLGTDGMSADERLKFEATYFVGQDAEVEKLKDLEKHPARLIQGDKAAQDVENAVNKYGYILFGKSYQSKKTIGSYTYTYGVAKKNGFNCLDFIFSITKESKWCDSKGGLSYTAFKTLASIWEYYPERRGTIHSLLCEELKNMAPTLFFARSRAAYPERELAIASVLNMQDIICSKMKYARKHIMYDGKKLCKAC